MYVKVDKLAFFKKKILRYQVSDSTVTIYL